MAAAPALAQDERLGDTLARMRPSLLRLAHGITRDEDAAADVVQRAFMKVLLHVSHFEARAAFRTWVWRIAMNEALQWRREQGRADRKLAAFADHASLSVESYAASPFDALARRQAMERLREGLARLPKCDQSLIENTLSASHSPIPAVHTQQGVCQRTLRTRLHRARQRLRRELGEER